MNYYYKTLILTLCMSLAACGPAGQSTKPAKSEATLAAEASASQLIGAGDYNAAAETYLKLAEENLSQAPLYQLKAAGALYQGSEIEQARGILNNTQADKLSELQALQKNILLAKIANHDGQANEALRLIDTNPKEDTPKSLFIAFHETRAEAFSLLAEITNAIHERLLAKQYTDPSSGHNINHDALWSDLNRLDVTRLEEMRLSSAADFSSWLDLALINKKMLGDNLNLQTAITDWQNLYPGHVANNRIIPDLFNQSLLLTKRAETVAVLLPMSGKYRQAALAIREGLMVGWHNDAGDKPELRFYNADSLNVNQAYQLAIEEGADFIIGPLEKEAVITLVNEGSPKAKTLTLNYYDGELPNPVERGIQAGTNFFQFALSPEDEARQVAERAYFAGHHKALVVSPNNLWGERIHNAFQQRLEQMGGQVLERAALPETTEDYANAIIALLNTDNSKARAKELRQALNRKMESETRRRQDVDFIFIASQPNDARQIVPHIYFQRAIDVPIYATSHIYSSTPNPELDADMNNIQFVDIPWILDPNAPYSDAKYIIEQNWPNNSSTVKRLFALGIDAYQVMSNLQQLSTQPETGLKGVTGILYINEKGQIQRRLSWARFRDGTPELLSNSL